MRVVLQAQLDDCYARGLLKREAAEALGLSLSHLGRVIHAQGLTDPWARTTRRAIEQRWGLEFWALLRDFAEQGLRRSQVAAALGYDYRAFRAMLTDNPENDPFEPYGVIANYVRDTGEPFGEALRRMAAAGYSLMQAQREIGYTDNGQPLVYAMKVRGIEVQFKRKPKAARAKKFKEPTVSGRYGPRPEIHPWRKTWAPKVEGGAR